MSMSPRSAKRYFFDGLRDFFLKGKRTEYIIKGSIVYINAFALYTVMMTSKTFHHRRKRKNNNDYKTFLVRYIYDKDVNIVYAQIG